MNPTTDPTLRSFVPVAADSHFPIQNLPYGVFTRGAGAPRVGVAIGDRVLDLTLLEECGLYPEVPTPASERIFAGGTLNAFLALGREAWTTIRTGISLLLRADKPTLRDDPALCRRSCWCLSPR